MKDEGGGEEDSVGATIFLCPNCRTIVGKKSRWCRLCGTIFEEEDIVEQLEGEEKKSQKKITLKDEKVEEEDSKIATIFLCPICRTGLGKRDVRCRICGTCFEADESVEKEGEEKETTNKEILIKDEGGKEEDSKGATILLCPNCKTIVDEKCTRCRICGVSFEEET